MIDPEPRWTHTSRTKLTRAYEFVRLHEDSVLGQWWCLDVDSGRVRWQAPELVPDTIVAVSEGVILATGIRSSGPTTTTAGNWAISLQTGELPWTDSEGVGLLTFLWLLLRGRTGDVAPEIVGVRGGECACVNGSILDIRSGRELRRERDLGPWRDRASASLNLWVSGRVEFAGAGFLTARVFENPAGRLLLQRLSPDGVPRWSFDSSDHPGSFPDGYRSFRFHGDYAYMIVSDAPFDIAAPTPRDWSLWTLDLRSGQPVQRLDLSQGSDQVHRIEDLDARYLLWSRGDESLSAHRVGGT